MRGFLRWVVCLLVAAGTVASLVGPALARHNFSMLVAEPREVPPGGEVTVHGFSYDAPVTIRFGALDGPMLARLEPDANEDIRGVVRIPPDAAVGHHIIFAFQEDDGEISRIPARAAITVGDAAIGTDVLDPEVEPRPAQLVARDGLTLGEGVLVALATVGVAALVVAAAALVVTARAPPRGVRRSR